MTEPAAECPSSGDSPLMSKIVAIVADVNNMFTKWLLFNNKCDVQDVLFLQSVNIGHLSRDESERLKDVLECHGFSVELRVNGDGVTFELGRVPTNDARRIKKKAETDDSSSSSDDDEPPPTCGICKAEVAIKPHYLKTCGHTFCGDCITDDCTKKGKRGSSKCPLNLCAASYRFRDIGKI